MPRKRGYYWYKMQELRDLRGGRCEVIDRNKRCAAIVELEFAHIKETGLNGHGRGRADRYHDIKKNPDSYKLMCKRHHREFDRMNRG